MPNPPKSRPVDALFGDDNAPALPSYIVEPPQPVTTVAPPPLDADVDQLSPIRREREGCHLPTCGDAECEAENGARR